MNSDTQRNWPFPGSRWWKFDFHTHTPASLDTAPWQRVKDTEKEVSPEKWLLENMYAGIDCVAVTDHNTGDWIDKLKTAYNDMKRQAEIGTPPDGFRKLTLFPGVEISVNAGFHLLAIFDPSASTQTIGNLLASVGYDGTHGDCDGVTTESPVNVMGKVLEAGGIPIPAHADQEKGLLRVKPGTRQCAMDSKTVEQVIASEELLAVEWLDTTLPLPGGVKRKAELPTRVLGSDCHSFQGDRAPGSRYTWIKMAKPTLEGLRLALLDGNGISVRRSDEGEFEPFQTPTNFMESVEVKTARYMGNGEPERLEFSPFYNALIGGRGSGKSTIVHALRLVYRRDSELRRLGEMAEPKRQFDSFSKTAVGREGEGALSDITQMRAVLNMDGVIHRLTWRQDGKGVVVEEQNNRGEWQGSSSQAITTERFPIRLFSQGQIAAMAGESRQALLDVIDEAADIGKFHRAFEEAKRTYFSQRAQLREMNGKLEGRSELQRKLDELNRKLEAFKKSDHSEKLKAHQLAARQQQEVKTSLQQLNEMPRSIRSLAGDLFLDDWVTGFFDSLKDQNILAWRDDLDRVLNDARVSLAETALALEEKAKKLSSDNRLQEWRDNVDNANEVYQQLQSVLSRQGVADPSEFGRLFRDCQLLENELKILDSLLQERDRLEDENKSQLKQVLFSRKAVTRARRKFVERTLADNKFVRMEVIGFGFDAGNMERSLRGLLDCQGNRFENDILQFDNGDPNGGIAFELAKVNDESREKTLELIKQELIDVNIKFKGHFKNFLERKFEKPEFEDHVNCWFPDDDLRIEYSRDSDGGNWAGIAQGSQGQRSAALLAFLLAFGNEPLVLDQPEDDLDNHLIYDLIVRQIRENKIRRQLIIVTHNPNIVVNGDAEMVHALDFRGGQCRTVKCGALQEKSVREEVCRVMEGGREAFSRRWARLGREV